MAVNRLKKTVVLLKIGHGRDCCVYACKGNKRHGSVEYLKELFRGFQLPLKPSVVYTSSEVCYDK